MSKTWSILLVTCLALTGLAILAWTLLFELPVYLGIIDVVSKLSGSNGPGRSVVVTLPQLLTHASPGVGLIIAAIVVWFRNRRLRIDLELRRPDSGGN